MIRTDCVHGTPPFIASLERPVKSSGPPSPLADLIKRRRLRSKVEASVQRLIDALDAIDDDPDLEPDGEQDRADEEPFLGWTDRIDPFATDRCDSSDRELDLTECNTRGAP